MCGICCIFSSRTGDQNRLKECIKTHSFLSCRGPDYSSQYQLTRGNTDLLFSGHVLHLRGNSLVPQPAKHENGDLLLWNGEIFDGIQVGEEENDTTVLLNLLASCDSDDNVLTTLSRIQGPWSFLYWQASSDTLWFGRDVFGRRSLLWHLPVDDSDIFCLTSVQIRPFEFQELPSVGIYKLTFTQSHDSTANDSATTYRVTLFPWQHVVWPGTLDKVVALDGWKQRLYSADHDGRVVLEMDECRQVPSQMPPLNKTIPSEDSNRLECLKQQPHAEYLEGLLRSDPLMRKLCRQLADVLLKAIKTRVNNQPSGPQLEKAINGSRRTRSISRRSSSPSDITTTGKQPGVGDHTRPSVHTGEDSVTSSAASDGLGNIAGIVAMGCEIPDGLIDECKQETISAAINRCTNNGDELSNNCDIDIDVKLLESSARIAILFSGGIDSTVIAALADRCVPIGEPIDLLNVAFEMRRKDHSNNKKMRVDDANRPGQWDVPDRIAGYTALSELNPGRTWNFVEVNISAAELQEMRVQRIRHLLYPLQTVMDDSIGCAVWFAARGRGILGNGAQRGALIQSTARVILCGMGADEQLIGYSRHRGRFQEDGWPGLLNEIELEVTRISARNLGRDDRIITDHGKESRFPFLDENVVQFLSSLPVHQKADLTLPRGLGEKLLLRLAAIELGLTQTATLPKRAIQFGSRIAKLENTKERASDVCSRLADLATS